MSNVKDINNITLPVYKRMKKEMDEKIPSEQAITNIAKQAIQADKDIISQITMEYDEENDFTSIYFPKGVMPLSITINSHVLFLKPFSLVDYNGEVLEGYEYDDYYMNDDKLVLDLIGNISDQVIKALVYINYNGTNMPVINNTYNLFFPQTETKLYKHLINFGYDHVTTGADIDDTAFPIYVISTNNLPYSLQGLLLIVGDNAIVISNDGGQNFSYLYVGEEQGQFTLNISNGNKLTLNFTNVNSFTDTVTEL